MFVTHEGNVALPGIRLSRLAFNFKVAHFIFMFGYLKKSASQNERGERETEHFHLPHK